MSIGTPLPRSQAERMYQIRDSMIRDIDAAIADLDSAAASEARELVAQVQQITRQPRAQQARAVRRLMRQYHRRGYDRLADRLAEMIADTAGYVARYEAILAGLVAQAQQGATPEAIAAAQAAHQMEYGPGAARAAVAYVRGRRRARAAIATEGDRLAAEHLTPWRGVRPLSRRLHGLAIADGDEAARQVVRSMRELDSLHDAARSIQRGLRRSGRDFAANRKFPQLMRQIQQAGADLARRAGPDELEQWRRTIRQLTRYQRGLASGSTVQTGYLELLQEIQDPSFKAEQIDKVVSRWSYYKQRHQAEVYVRTETATAYRLAQLDADGKRPWIVGYIWRLNRGTHAGFKRRYDKRHKSGRKGLGGARCICEALSGQRISVETAREYPSGGHPHCNCTFEPVYDRQAMLAAPSTEAELAAVEGLDI